MKNRIAESISIVKSLRNWSIFYTDYFGMDKAPIKTFLFRNGLKIKFRGNRRDASTVKEVGFLDEYKFAQETLPENAVIIDIGAHIGTFSLMAAKRYPKARIISFEPLPENCQFFLENVELNHFKNIKLRREVVAAKSGELTFNMYDNVTAGTLFIQENDAPSGTISCNAVTLDSVFESERIDRCHCLKLDCEGAEFEILLNAPDALLRRIDVITMEYHNGLTPYSHKDLEKRLTDAGFKLVWNHISHLLHAART